MNKYSIDEKKIKNKLGEILETINFSEDPKRMDVYRKLIRRNIPIFRRSYFTAYLFKTLFEGASFKNKKNFNKKEPRSNYKNDQRSNYKNDQRSNYKNEQKPRNSYQKPYENRNRNDNTQKSNSIKTLYINIGRQNGINQEEILKHLLNNAKFVQENHVKGIRIFEKFSFVDVDIQKADEVLAKNNQTKLRDCVIEINYAHSTRH